MESTVGLGLLWLMHTQHAWPAPLDLFGLGLIAVLLILGLARGLWWQVIRLVGVTAAILAARCVGPVLAAWLHSLWPELSSRARHGIAWGGIFALTLGAASLFGLLGQRLLEAMKLDLANRVAGAFAGAATGLFVHVAIVLLVCQLAPEPFLGHYVAGTYSERLYAAVGIRWPVALASDAAWEIDRVLEQSPLHVHPPRSVVR